jgi:large repetitive protein
LLARPERGRHIRIARVGVLVAAVALVAAPTAAALRFTDDSYATPVGTVGSTYTHRFKGDGGCGPDPNVPGSGLPYQFRILSGSLPPGLTLAKDGLVSGTPTQAGTWSFWVELSDQDPPSASWCTPAKSEREFTITINSGGASPQPPPAPPPPPPTPLSVNAPSLPIGTPGVLYPSTQLTVAGGARASWSVTAGAFPPGMTLSAAGGLSGIPTRDGDYTFTVRATSGAASGTRQLTVSIVQRLEASVPDTLVATVGRAVSEALSATGGRQPYAFAATGLPAGLSVDGGRIVGTPGAVGEFPVTVTVTDRIGGSATKQVRLSVFAALAAPTATPTRGLAGKAVTITLRATGGRRPYTFAVTGLPAGLALDASGTKIVGTPSSVGEYPLTVTVSDSIGGSTPAALTLEIRSPLAFAKRLKRSLPDARLGKKYRFWIPVTGAAKPSFVAIGSVPPGLRLNERTGLLTGRARRSGRFRITLNVVDRYGVLIERVVTLRVKR